jgi:hypothetical protein
MRDAASRGAISGQSARPEGARLPPFVCNLKRSVGNYGDATSIVSHNL